ncbi:MAG: RDD family protein [Gammaproteobacteria bacterium]|nr:RDD family protein [Gammaproteobacteria bacterium]
MSDNPYAASATRLARGTVEQSEIALASRFKRLVARIIDGLLHGVLFFLCIYFVPASWDRYWGGLTDTPTETSTSDIFQPLLFAYDISFVSLFEFLLSIAIVFVIQGYFLAQFGQTIGKMALNIKIVDVESNEKPTLTRLFVVRECGMSVISILPILSLIDVLWIFGPARRCVHDYWSSTIVIKA